MPLDVSFVLNDPLLSDTFDVRRCSETVGPNGRASTVSEWVRGLTGIVTPVESSRLKRHDDGQFENHEINVQCEFALRDATLGVQPDFVFWDGREYLVVEVLPFQRIAGYTTALCSSTRMTDNAPPQ